MLAHIKTNIGSLRCSNVPAGCETRYAQTVTSPYPRLILCFSADLNVKFKVKSKD